MAKPMDDDDLAAMDTAEGAFGGEPLTELVGERVRVHAAPPLPAHPDAPPAIVLPAAHVDVELFDEAMRKMLIESMFDGRARAMLLDGLTRTDPKERRQWWAMALGMVGKPNPDRGEGGSVKIILNQGVPGPGYEDGPVGRAPAIEVRTLTTKDPG